MIMNILFNINRDIIYCIHRFTILHSNNSKSGMNTILMHLDGINVRRCKADVHSSSSSDLS